MKSSDKTGSLTLILDDGAPVNVMYWHEPSSPRRRLIPNAFVQQFAELCEEHGVKGKFSVIPMPCGLGRIDQSLNEVPSKHLRRFIDIVQRQITPRFDITPEVLTHLMAVKVPGGGFHHLYEDEWVARASMEELTDYFALALHILNAVELPANGFTSPWNTGITNEKTYVRAMAAAQWRVNRRKHSWYFLHTTGRQTPWVAWRNPRTGQRMVSIPTNTDDVFWRTQIIKSGRGRARAAQDAADAWLSPTGDSGAASTLIGNNVPVTLLTHWQSLFSEGHATGLRGLQIFLKRLRDRYGDRVQWLRCSELAKTV